jgi:hypothetical protein
MSFIEYIPAKRFGIRIKSSQRMSVFAQIDISEDKVYEISRWIIGNEKASKLSKCVSIFGKACGCALEINKQGTPRLRFYGMIASRQQLDDYFQVAVAKDLINPNIKKRSAALWNSFAVEDLSVVLNIASSGSMLAKNSQNKEDDISLKLEFPNVSYMKVLQHLADYSQKIIFQRALSHLLASQGSIFPYIGVRLNRDNDTYTYYIDVNRVLRGRIST